MRKLFIGLMPLFAGLWLAGCEQPRTVAEISPLYRPAELGRAGGGRDTYVVLRGNPLAMDPAQFEQTILAQMQGRNWGPRTNFTTRPANYDNAYKVVMLFNGPPVNSGELCRNPGAIPFRTGPQAELHIQAAYCRYDQARTAAQGWLRADSRGVSPESLGRLIGQVTAELFPPDNPEDARRDSDPPRRTN